MSRCIHGSRASIDGCGHHACMGKYIGYCEHMLPALYCPHCFREVNNSFAEMVLEQSRERDELIRNSTKRVFDAHDTLFKALATDEEAEATGRKLKYQ